MNILIFSEAAWDNKNSFGNTVSNFFDGNIWKNDTFCNFYCRNQIPDNEIEVNYYNLSAVDIVRGMIKGRIFGRRLSTKELEQQKASLDKTHKNEKRKIDKIHQKSNHLIYLLHEMIWMNKLWLNCNFKAFVSENNPDILFAFAASPFILWPLIKYLTKNTQCKIVLLVADEVYGNYNRLPFYRRGYLKKYLKNCIVTADRMYGISDEMSELYHNTFGISIRTLYKGCDLSCELKTEESHPLKMVYAGNLLWGRDKTLGALAKVLENINKEEIKVVLEIYTGTTVTKELSERLNISNSSKIMGSRSYEEIKQIMHMADITIHVESFNEKQIQLVKYSFSTKIIDCLQSGSCVLGIGPSGIASIEYLKKINGAHVIDDLSMLSNAVTELVKHPQNLLQDAKFIRKYALRNHEITAVQEKLRKELLELID
ncbi:MAG: hypothetical protein PHW34_10425 [Hespellia sp.]|nr:hypothetical protein [Hespellia sp.]